MGLSKHKKSKSSDDTTISFSDVVELIESSTSNIIEIGWYFKKETLLEHTGLVVFIDGKADFTIDFGTEDNIKSTERKKGKVEINWWNSCYVHIGMLTKVKKDYMVDFAVQCTKYNPDYDLMSQNCRNFVMDVVESLITFQAISDKHTREFLWKMKEIVDKDISKIKLLNKLFSLPKADANDPKDAKILKFSQEYFVGTETNKKKKTDERMFEMEKSMLDDNGLKLDFEMFLAKIEEDKSKLT